MLAERQGTPKPKTRSALRARIIYTISEKRRVLIPILYAS